MSQNDFNLANQGFPSMRADMNSALQALASNSSGATPPATTYAYQWWYDDASDILKFRNGDNDAFIDFASFNQATDSWFIPSVDITGGTIDGTVIGGSNPSAGAFTSLTLNGVPVIAELASQAQAEAGTDNETLMTPLRTAEAIEELAGGGGGLEPGDGIISARPLGMPEFISQPGAYLKSDFPLIGDLDFLDTSSAFWSTVTSGFGTIIIEDVATDGSGVWVAVGRSGTMTRSTDNGQNWSTVTSGFGSTNIRGIATDGSGTWVAVGDGGVMTRSTDNGANWSTVTSGFGVTTIRGGVATDGSGTWVAVGDGGVMTRSTDNGANWSTVTSGFGVTINAVATDGSGTWVAVGTSGLMTRSTDNGANWSAVSSGFGVTIQGVATDGSGVWVAVGNGGLLRRSTDNGQNWSGVGSGFGTLTINAVATDGSGTWVAVGNGGLMTRSTDNGANWSAVTSGFGATILGVATDGSGVWVAVGAIGVMTRSEPSATEFVVTEFFADALHYLFTGETA